jgi:hypothetical protein
MPEVVPFDSESQSAQDQAPVYLPQQGVYQYADGKLVDCYVLWNTDSIKNSIVTYKEFDEEDIL